MKVLSAFSPQSFNPIAMSRVEWRPVVRSPKQLRLHPAMEELGWIGVIGELNDAARLKQPLRTRADSDHVERDDSRWLGRWRLACSSVDTKSTASKYPRSMRTKPYSSSLTHHQPRRGWNAFVRIRLALTLEPNLQQRALDNMRAGGKYKGSTNLSEADRIDVREKIAKRAGTGTGNVGKVKAILRSAHPNIIAALQTVGSQSIELGCGANCPNCSRESNSPSYEEERTQRKILQEFLPKPASVSLDPAQVIEALQRLEAWQPGSIDIRTSRRLRRTVVTLGQDFLRLPGTQKELDW